jgi:hypothetical protein
MSVVVQVRELVAPLCYYAERILNEGDDDQEASNCGQVPVQHPLASSYPQAARQSSSIAL